MENICNTLIMIYSVHCAWDFSVELAEFFRRYDGKHFCLPFVVLRCITRDNVCVWWSQSDDEDLDLAPAQTEEGFAFDSNVQMPDDGFQLWWQVARLILTICSAEVLARWLQLIPLLHSILCSPIFMLTRSSSLPSTVTVFDSVEGAGALSIEVKILGDFRNCLTTSCLQSCLCLMWLAAPIRRWHATVLCWKYSFSCYRTVYKPDASFVMVILSDTITSLLFARPLYTTSLHKIKYFIVGLMHWFLNICTQNSGCMQVWSNTAYNNVMCSCAHKNVVTC